MKTAEKIKRLFFKSNVTVGSKVDDKILGDTLSAFEKSIASDSVDYRPNMWRIIMKSKMTKFAATAVIILAVFLGANYFDSSLQVTSVALGQVLEKMSEVPFMRAVTTEIHGDSMRKHVHWCNFRENKTFAEYDKTIWCWDQNANKQYMYRFLDKLLIISKLPEDDFYGSDSAYSLVKDFIEYSKSEQDKIHSTKEWLNGIKAEVFTVRKEYGEETPMFMDSQPVFAIERVLIIDPAKCLLIEAKAKYLDKNGQVITFSKVEVTYPQNGPSQIYDLGVPRDAEVIDMLPSLGMKELAEIFNRKRERFSPHVFICVEPSQGFLYINHIKGDTFDAAKYYEYVHHNYWIPNHYNICDEIEDRAFEFAESLHKRSDAQLLSASLWDGKKLHRIDCVDWSVSKSIEPGNIRSVGHFWPISGLADKIIEDDYSKSHNLVAIKTGRILRYFDPLHDYVCVRYESRIEDGKVLLRELTDLVQTKEGYWYPRREKGIVIDFDENGEETSREQTFEHMYYVEKMENISKEFFDVEDNISRILKRN